MKVVILCGGQGTRIRDVSETIPKPMINIGRYPILWHIMKYYRHWGHREFILCLGYKGQVIKDFFLNYQAHTHDLTIHLGDSRRVEYYGDHGESDWVITLADTGSEAMTGARVKRIQKYVGQDKDFMLTYGDGVGTIDLGQLAQFHHSNQKILTVSGVSPPGRFGELQSDSEGRVIEFNEKSQAQGGRISGGFFVCRRELFDYIDDRDDVMFEQEPIRRLVADGEMMVYEHDGFWHPMDTYRDYLLLNRLYHTGDAPWMIWD